MQKVRFLKILSLFVSWSVAQFHRETTLRTPRELPETAQTKKVRFVKIEKKSPFVFSDTKGDFFCTISCRNEKNVVPLHPKAQRRGLEGGKCLLLESQIIWPNTPVAAFKTYLKGVYCALFWQSEISQISTDKNLATIDVLRDIDYPSCAYFGTCFAYIRVRIRVP